MGVVEAVAGGFGHNVYSVNQLSALLTRAFQI